MFASTVSAIVQVGDVTVHIRKLSARALERASDAQADSAAKTVRRFGADIMKALREAPIADAASPVVLSPDNQKKVRYAAYDRPTVLVAGITEWSAERALAEGIQDLDEETAQKLHEAILDLSLPPIDPKAAEGKG
jgi:hypothetical protein